VALVDSKVLIPLSGSSPPFFLVQSSPCPPAFPLPGSDSIDSPLPLDLPANTHSGPPFPLGCTRLGLLTRWRSRPFASSVDVVLFPPSAHNPDEFLPFYFYRTFSLFSCVLFVTEVLSGAPPTKRSPVRFFKARLLTSFFLLEERSRGGAPLCNSSTRLFFPEIRSVKPFPSAAC